VETNVDLAALGRLLASPARAAMLDALFDGRSWAVGELAAVAGVAVSTASEHLRLLRGGGLVVDVRDGRRRLFRLSGPEVAEALELLGTLAPRTAVSGLKESARNGALHRARTCYDHLAGRLGVAVADALLERRLLLGAEDGFAPTPLGERAFARVGIDVGALRRSRRPLARACLDWSERRPHLAGGLGAALLARLDAVNGIERLPTPRALRLLPPGEELLRLLGAPPLVS
jgi:DNA-binding transcriptional ArsR family regulator